MKIICNPLHEPIYSRLKPGCVPICTQEACNKLKIDDSNEPIVVDVLTSFKDQSLIDFDGFFIAAAELRTKKQLLNPIIFTSLFYDKPYFEELAKTNANIAILFAPGTYFIEFPFTLTTVLDQVNTAQSNPINKTTLADINAMLCNFKGLIIDKLNHDLSFNKDVKEPLLKITAYLTAAQKQKINLNEYRDKLIESKKSKNELEFNTVKLNFIKECEQKLLPQTIISPITPSLTEGEFKHTLLVVEDNPEFLQTIEDQLSPFFTIKGYCNSKDAIEALDKDVCYDIKVVIADWRLYQNYTTQNYWQAQQGYAVLEHAATNAQNFRALFALTSLNDGLLHNIRNQLGFKFHLVKKENLHTVQSWCFFADLIQEKCQEVIQETYNMLSGAHWAKYKPLYLDAKYKLDSPLNKVEERVNVIFEIIKAGHFHRIKYNLNEITQNVVEESLIERLVQRRIWILLDYIIAEDLTNKDIKIAKNLYRGDSTKPIEVETRQIKMKLFIKGDDIQNKNFLPEEYVWLKNKCQDLSINF